LELGSAFAELRGRSVFVTGHTGFKGSWLALWLHHLGALVHGYALPPETRPSNFKVSRVPQVLSSHHEADVRDGDRLAAAILAAQPDVIFHLAAQPLVRRAHLEPKETFDVNVVGTASLLDAIRALNRPCAVIVVTSDKCYADTADAAGCEETDTLGGGEPYGASKAAAEFVVAAYQNSYFPTAQISEHQVQLATVRAGNVIGGGDWAADRIVPDIVAALNDNRPVQLRNPQATRPWQHVLDALSGYLALAQRMLRDGDPQWSSAWNFGPSRGSRAVQELVELFLAEWGQGEWENISDATDCVEAQALVLNAEKATAQLAWKPVWNTAQTVTRTARWYRRFYQEQTASCIDDIQQWHTDQRSAEVQPMNLLDTGDASSPSLSSRINL
jgi:CDP-glucose 4,6-dehydratase